MGGNENYIKSGPPYLIFLHPALGPLWEVSRQKVISDTSCFLRWLFSGAVVIVCVCVCVCVVLCCVVCVYIYIHTHPPFNY